jgi:iron complex transport system permease protein
VIAVAHRAVAGRLVGPLPLLVGLTGLCAAALLVGVGVGAVRIAPGDSIAIIFRHLGLETGIAVDPQDDAILWLIRLPRVVLGALVGAGLAAAGAALQGVFRNPLADPGLVGVASGASLGAVAAIVLGFTGFVPGGLQVAAFAGGVAAAALVYALARYEGRTETVTLLLTGVAVTAITGAAIGILLARADDAELRDVVFWSLGSLGAATWPLVAATAPFVLVGVLLACAKARELDLLALGEREAANLGVYTERTRGLALATGAAVAAAGVVGFVGLVVPHLVRLAAGPRHAIVVPASALGGAALVVLADVAARTVAAPVELPLGVITALVGGPFFLWLLWRTRAHGGWG